MKVLLLTVLILPIFTSCYKHPPQPFFEEESYLAQYGRLYYPFIIEIIPSDSINLVDSLYKKVYIDKYVFHNISFGFDSISQSYYPRDTTLLGSLVWNDNSSYYDKSLYLITPKYIDIIDTINVISRDAFSITFGINKDLANTLFINAYDKYTQRNRVSFLANERIHIIVYYQGTQSAKEVAKFINTRFAKQAMYGWVNG